MYQVKVIYNNDKDKELLNLVDTTIPFFVDYVNMNTVKGRKEGIKLMNYWGAKKVPFVVIEDSDSKSPIIKYSDVGENAVNQLIKFLNESKI